MAPLSDIVEGALGRGARRVVLEGGQPPLAELSHGMEPMGGEIVQDELFSLLSDLLDEDRLADLAVGNPVDVEVAFRARPVRLQADPRPDGIVVLVLPQGDERPGIEAPAAPVPEAPAPSHLALGGEDDDEVPPPAASTSSGSWLPLDIDVVTGEIDLGDEPEAAPSEVFPSDLSDGIGVPVAGDDGAAADPKTPTRGDVPSVGHEVQAPQAVDTRDGGSWAAAEDADRATTARELPLGVDAPDRGSWAAAEDADRATTARELPLGVVVRAEEADAGAVEGSVGGGLHPVAGDRTAAARAGTDTWPRGAFRQWAAVAEPGRLYFVHLGASPGRPAASDLANAVLAELGRAVHVLSERSAPSDWLDAERSAASGGAVFVDLLDPSLRARDILRMVESEGLVFVVTNARNVDGARRVFAAGRRDDGVADWLDAVGTAWIALTGGAWQFS